MRIITKYGAMLLALCINFGHIEAAERAYWEEWEELSSLPPNEEYSPKRRNTQLSQDQAI